MQELENCMFSLRVHCDEQTYLVSSDRPFVVVLGKLPYMNSNVHMADQFQVVVGF